MDQGTTSSRAVIFDHEGNIISMAQKEFKQIYPKPGWIEHDPVDILTSQTDVTQEALSNAGLKAADIECIGITNQRETTIVWNKKTGIPVYNAIVWQCRRTSDKIDRMKEAGMSEYVKSKTGLIPDAYFSASKIWWILENVKGAREEAAKGNLLFGTVDTWIVWNLTGGKVHVTDYSNASRTMLYDIHNLCWDKRLLDYFGIPESMLPEVTKSSRIYGTTQERIFGSPIVISGIAGDQQAALFGQCCFEPGDAKNTYGTGCFLLMNTGEKAIDSQNGLLTTIAACTEDKIEYALEGSVFIAGAAIQWLRDEMKLIEKASMSKEYAESAEDCLGMYIVPAFTGLGAPYWNQHARGMVVGITRGCGKKHFVRATLEAIDYQVHDVLKAMEEDSETKLNTLKVDGGASANDFLMGFQSDILGTPVCRPRIIETTALGAAYLAGLATGYFKDKEDIKKNWQLEKAFYPSMDENKRDSLIKGWKKAVKCAMIWTEE